MSSSTSVPAAPASAPGPQGGLRARHKARTRAAIRAAALDLISRQGYAATTVAQIAEAAEVSHTTFFRYFQTKEQVIISDDLEDERWKVIAAIPPGLGRFDLMRRIVVDMFTLDAQDPWCANVARMHLIRSEQALRTAHQIETDRVVSDLTGFISEYTGVDPENMRLRVFIAAVSGVMFHIAERVDEPNQEALDDLMAALDLLEQGLPL